MADTTTTNLSLTKPELDVSTNWGQKLNANLDAIDAIFSGTGTGVSLNIDGGDIASAVTINKSPVITLGGDLTGNVTLTNLASGTLTASLVAESVQDIVGPMFSSNTENAISVGYEDSDGTIDLSVLVDDSSIEISGVNNTLNVKALGVTNAMLAGSIANSKLSNSSITVGAGLNSTAISLGGTINFSGTSNEVEVAESSGTITISLPATINANTTGSAATLTTARNIGGVSFDGSADITPTTFAAATFSGDLNVDSGVLFADVSTNRVGINQATPTVSLDLGSNTDAILVPVGTTAQRPTGANGHFRYNTDDAQFEGYADGAWGAIAGSGGASGSVFDQNTFTGDGSTTAFTLAESPSGEDNTIVFIDGVYQADNTYSVSGTTLTFATAPASSRIITVYTITGGVIGTAPSIDTMTGDGSDTTLTLSIAPASENSTFVTIDGVVQHKSTYSVSGTTLTFSTAPPSGTAVECISFANTTVTTTKLIQDADEDTKIQVEESSDEDKIRFDTGGTERMVVGSDGKVGVGIEATEGQLHVKSDSSGEVELLTLENSTGTNGIATLTLKTTSTDSTKSAQIAAKRVNASGHTDLIFRTYNGSTSDAMTIDHDGIVTKAYQPAFDVDYNGTASIADGNYLVYPNVRLNTGSHYSTSTGKFTAPVAGNYLIYWDAIGGNDDDVYRFKLHKNDAQYLQHTQLRIDTPLNQYGNGTKVMIVPLAASDTLRIYYDSDAGNVSYANDNYLTFGGHLIG